jgi:hypothetical protein
MNEKLQASLVEVIQFLLKWAQETKDVVVEQAPLVVREAIAYGRALETWELTGLLILLGLYVWCVRWFRRHEWFDTDFEEPPIAHIFTGVGGFALVLAFSSQMPDVLKVWFAPRLYVLEWAAQLLKTATK